MVRVDVRALAAWGGKQPTKPLRMSGLHTHARTRTLTHTHALSHARALNPHIYSHTGLTRFLVFWYFRFGFGDFGGQTLIAV